MCACGAVCFARAIRLRLAATMRWSMELEVGGMTVVWVGSLVCVDWGHIAGRLVSCSDHLEYPRARMRFCHIALNHAFSPLSLRAVSVIASRVVATHPIAGVLRIVRLLGMMLCLDRFRTQVCCWVLSLTMRQ